MLTQAQVTVYPAIAGSFPPASFWLAGAAYRYMRDMQDQGATCGLCECPASSFAKHFPGTVRGNH